MFSSTADFTLMTFDVDLVCAMVVLYALLACASFTAFLLNKQGHGGQLGSRINAWWLIFPVVTVALLFYPVGLAVLAIVIGMLVIRELAFHAGASVNRFRLLATMLVLFIIPCSYVSPASMFLLVFGGGGLFLLFWVSRRPVLLPWVLLCLVVLSLCILIQLTTISLDKAHARAWIFYLFVLTALNDIGQFVFGKWLGKRKITPRISPNKTWGGLWGGVGVSVVVSLLLGAWLGLAEPLTLVVMAIVLALTGFLGDILFSAAKRFMGIKDFSELIPGHGGILDRIDSLTITTPVMYGLLSILY